MTGGTSTSNKLVLHCSMSVLLRFVDPVLAWHDGKSKLEEAFFSDKLLMMYELKSGCQYCLTMYYLAKLYNVGGGGWLHFNTTLICIYQFVSLYQPDELYCGKISPILRCKDKGR